MANAHSIHSAIHLLSVSSRRNLLLWANVRTSALTNNFHQHEPPSLADSLAKVEHALNYEAVMKDIPIDIQNIILDGTQKEVGKVLKRELDRVAGE